MDNILDVLETDSEKKKKIAASKILVTQNIPLLFIVAIWQLSIFETADVITLKHETCLHQCLIRTQFHQNNNFLGVLLIR